MVHKRVHRVFDKYVKHILCAGPRLGWAGMEKSAPEGWPSVWITREQRGAGGGPGTLDGILLVRRQENI